MKNNIIILTILIFSAVGYVSSSNLKIVKLCVEK